MNTTRWDKGISIYQLQDFSYSSIFLHLGDCLPRFAIIILVKTNET